MSITNKKIDALRRLLLGNLYQECKDNPMGVSRERLEQHLEKIKGEGCIGECSVEEFVKTCQLKSHYPTCVSGEYRGCVEDIGERSTGVDKFYYNQYKTSKMFENEPDTDEEEDEEGEVCNVCGLTGDDDIGLPVQEMSCGHHSHVNCLIKIAQQKGRDNAECPECRKEFSLEEVPVPVRTLQQRQADSMRRAQFNASQMGFEIRRPVVEEEEQSEEDRMSQRIESDIENNDLNRAITGIRELYTREVNRRTMIEYIRKWSNTIVGLLEDEENVDINQIKSVIDIIFQVNITLSSFNNRFIKGLRQLYNRGNESRKEVALYFIKSITKHLIVDRRSDGLYSFVEIMMGNSSVELFEEVMRVAEENNANESLKESINEAIEQLDLDRVNDDIKNLITGWFTRHNYEPPNLTRENMAEDLSNAIVEYIRTRYFIGAEEAIKDFYEREFEDNDEYIYVWYKALIEQIKTGELETENVIGLVDVMFTKDHPFFLSKRSLQEIERIMDMGENQKQQVLYLFSKIISIYITEFPAEEQLGLIIGSVIEINSIRLLREIMRQAQEDEGLEVLRDHLTDVITDIDIEDERMKDNIRRWYREHNFEIPSSFVEEDDIPLQISRLTPPEQKVRRGGWFNRVRKY